MIAEPLDAEAFLPYGSVIGRPSSAADAEGPGWSWWAEAGRLPADARPYAVGHLALEPAPLTADWAECHARAAELIFPLGGDCIVYVAPPAEAPQAFRAFRVGVGTGVRLDAGVWHGAPLAIGRPLAAIVLLPKGTGAQDTRVARFPENPIRIEV
jgi:ureidoglycolate hydrolase